MKQSAQRIINGNPERLEEKPSQRLSFLKFFARYPILLLLFGPPIFRASDALKGVDTSQAHFDLWNIFQVGWLAVPTARAIFRLIFAQSLSIPKQIQAVLRLALFLGLLYLISAIYSPGRVVSAEFAILYFFTMICVVEFVVDVYRNPPNWVQCLFQLRLVAVLGLIIILLTLPFRPALVLNVIQGAGIRLLGGTVGNTALLGSVIAIISAYAFLHSLESKALSMFLFLVGLAATLITQWRGAEIALFLLFPILGFQWAKTSGRATYLFISGSIASILLAAVAVTAIGGDKVWKTFNRGQGVAAITSASGRTEMWSFAFTYCLKHPWGMGYVSGFRYLFTRALDFYFGNDVSRLGNCHNSFVQVLADAGWLALALYLVMNFRVVALAWRFAKKYVLVSFTTENGAPHAIRCALMLLFFCFVDGMDTSEFDIPLRQPFYFQCIIVAIILGACARMLMASRIRRPSLIR
jgi:hypothetical protein